MNKNLMIGLGVLAVAGIGLYMWKRRKDEESSPSDEKKSNARGSSRNTSVIIEQLDSEPTISGHVMQFANGCTRSCTASNSNQTGNWYVTPNGNWACSGVVGALKCGGESDINAVPFGDR